MLLMITLFGCGFEGDPPVLQVSAPEETVAGPIRLEVSAEDASTPVGLEVRLDAGEWRLVEPVDGVVTVAVEGVADGTHTLELRGTDAWRNTAIETVAVSTDNSPPQVDIAERSLRVQQGHTLPVMLRMDEPGELTADVLGQPRTLYELEPGVFRALVGVAIRTEAGEYPLTVTARDAYGNVSERVVPIEVEAVEWPSTGLIPLSKREARVEPAGVKRMRLERDAVYRTVTPEQLWSGAMQVPTLGEATSGYGTFREYPDGTRSFHDAEDIANDRGTPIYAAAAGTVALAHRQEVHGNAVLLQHGQKVVSLYSHMRTLEVKAGQQVLAGERIGLMGSTGRSTGPHLHWGILVDEVAVDPMQWVEQSFEADAFAELIRVPEP